MRPEHLPLYIKFLISIFINYQNVSLDEAALIEPLAVSYNALISNSEIKKNSSVLIFGAGTIGLLSLKIAHFKKAKIFLVCTPKDKIQKKIAIKNKVSKFL